ncbi:hypothetical protein KCU65_g987, partial [Aureobasidium melanogenum]
MATKQLTSWALSLQFANLTTPAVDMAVKSSHNWGGCAIGGYHQPLVEAVQGAMLPFAAPGNSSLFGIQGWYGAQHKALINGLASHVDDYDDTHVDTPIHPSGPVASALLAFFEWKDNITGADFLTAFVAGLETEMKLGLSYAISTASIQVIGMHSSFGTDQKPFHIGRAAQSGLISAVMAKGGLHGALDVLEDKLGWANVVSTRNNVTDYFNTLGKVWETTQNTFKPYPCDRVLHAPIDEWIQIRKQALDQGSDLSSITNNTARTNPSVLFLTDDPDPQTGLAAKFSFYHAAAISLLIGQATPTQFSDEVVRNKTIKALSQKVSVTDDKSVPEYSAYVSVTFGDGTVLDAHVEHAIGSYANPLSDDYLKMKFLDQVSKQIGEDKAQAAHKAFLDVVNLKDMRDLTKAFTGDVDEDDDDAIMACRV